jgi:hypothetical protein
MSCGYRKVMESDAQCTGPPQTGNRIHISYSDICFSQMTKRYVGFEVLTTAVMTGTIFWDITPCSALKVNRPFTLVSCSAHSSTLKMETICSSETSVDFQQNTRRYIPEDRTLYEKLA